jgi:hypothetical protein
MYSKFLSFRWHFSCWNNCHRKLNSAQNTIRIDVPWWRMRHQNSLSLFIIPTTILNTAAYFLDCYAGLNPASKASTQMQWGKFHNLQILFRGFRSQILHSSGLSSKWRKNSYRCMVICIFGIINQIPPWLDPEILSCWILPFLIFRMQIRYFLFFVHFLKEIWLNQW